MAQAAARPRPARWWWVWLIGAGLLAADQATKAWAEATLAGQAPVPVIGELIRFRLTYNGGAAFGIGADHTWIFTIAAATAVLVLGYLARRVGPRTWAVGLGLLFGGAASHLLDRLTRAPGFARGHVVDFIDYNRWFVGNVADAALTLAAGLIILLSLRGVPLTGAPDPAGDPPAGPTPAGEGSGTG